MQRRIVDMKRNFQIQTGVLRDTEEKFEEMFYRLMLVCEARFAQPAGIGAYGESSGEVDYRSLQTTPVGRQAIGYQSLEDTRERELALHTAVSVIKPRTNLTAIRKY